MGLVDHVPTRNTIDNWVRKCGLDELNCTPDDLENVDYAILSDECMMIGSQKLLPVVAIPANHQGRPVKPEDVSVIGLNVAPAWNAENASAAMRENLSSVSHGPLYAVTDNNGMMKKSVSKLGIKWYNDISHTLAMFMERTYKDDPEFVNFNKEMALCKMRYNMKEVAYLQSPTQRTVARFMNLTSWVEWSDNVMSIFSCLSSMERDVFSYLPKYASFIEEMKDMIEGIRYIERVFKHDGLSKRNCLRCRTYVIRNIMCGNERMRKVGHQILEYLTSQEALLNDNDVHNNSTDILESMFGAYKYMKSPNKLNGVTPLVLHLPVMLKYGEPSSTTSYNVKQRLCNIKIRDIESWKSKNLLPNLVAKRIQVLRLAT